MKLVIKSLDNRCFDIITDSQRIENIKFEIQKSKGLNPSEFQLIWNGSILKDDVELPKNISDGETLVMVFVKDSSLTINNDKTKQDSMNMPFNYQKYSEKLDLERPEEYFGEELKHMIEVMGYDKERSYTSLLASNGDINIAIEYLSIYQESEEKKEFCNNRPIKEGNVKLSDHVSVVVNKPIQSRTSILLSGINNPDQASVKKVQHLSSVVKYLKSVKNIPFAETNLFLKKESEDISTLIENNKDLYETYLTLKFSQRDIVDYKSYLGGGTDLPVLDLAQLIDLNINNASGELTKEELIRKKIIDQFEEFGFSRDCIEESVALNSGDFEKTLDYLTNNLL